MLRKESHMIPVSPKSNNRVTSPLSPVVMPGISVLILMIWDSGWTKPTPSRGLPFINSDSSVQKISRDNIKKLEESEEKILDLTVREKTELESKIGGKIKFP